MTLDDLDNNIRTELINERKNLYKKWRENSAYRVCLTNSEGTRYFLAVRCCLSWSNDKGGYMTFGGGSVWKIKYGKIKWSTGKDAIGDTIYFWKQSAEVFSKSANGTIIPNQVDSKKEVLDIIKKIGTLEM